MREVSFLIFTYEESKSLIISNVEDTQISCGRAINSILVLFNYKDHILKLTWFATSDYC